MRFEDDIRGAVIARTLRVPRLDGPEGDGAAAARQLDVALMAVGFKLSHELLVHLSTREPVAVLATGQAVLAAMRELVGDHVRHNTYFRDFPAGVPDTVEFWNGRIAEALGDERTRETIAAQLRRGVVNLLDLPRYGRYQHTFEDLLAAHEPLVASADDRMTVLALGGPFAQESRALFATLAASRVPLNEADLTVLGALAAVHVSDTPVAPIAMRESRAVVNRARLEHGLDLEADTVVDVLRLAVALSDGDVSLTEPAKLRSLPRAHRRALLAALDAVVAPNPAKLGDVNRFAERFKRLGERLHPHEQPRWPAAQRVFAVARGEETVRSFGARVELALAGGDADAATAILSAAPGMLLRSVDRLARGGATADTLAGAVGAAARAVEGRVLLALREHLLNRDGDAGPRVFVNREGRAWVTEDERAPLPPETIEALTRVLDEALVARLPDLGDVAVEDDARTVAVPLTDKQRPSGIGILPRGTTMPAPDHVRFFVHWREHAQTTDFDLSMLLLDHHFDPVEQVSWTNLRGAGITHSGDITSAPAGASEFIDVDLDQVKATYAIPQVNIFSGESFDGVDEAFFGFMHRPPGRRGMPFEPRTVRAKSDLSGPGRVLLPLAFVRGDDRIWTARWLHLNLAGHPQFNRVEGNAGTTSLVVRAALARRHLTIGDLEPLLRAAATDTTRRTTIGIDDADLRPADLPGLLSSA